jgi:drug/metabolite transporter (DMT)-like permease
LAARATGTEQKMSRSFRERMALYLIVGMFFFSGLFVGLWVFTEEFSATGGTLAGVILTAFVSAFVGIVGRDLLDRALAGREDGEAAEESSGKKK